MTPTRFDSWNSTEHIEKRKKENTPFFDMIIKIFYESIDGIYLRIVVIIRFLLIKTVLTQSLIGKNGSEFSISCYFFE